MVEAIETEGIGLTSDLELLAKISVSGFDKSEVRDGIARGEPI